MVNNESVVRWVIIIIVVAILAYSVFDILKCRFKSNLVEKKECTLNRNDFLPGYSPDGHPRKFICKTIGDKRIECTAYSEQEIRSIVRGKRPYFESRQVLWYKYDDDGVHYLGSDIEWQD